MSDTKKCPVKICKREDRHTHHRDALVRKLNEMAEEMELRAKLYARRAPTPVEPATKLLVVGPTPSEELLSAIGELPAPTPVEAGPWKPCLRVFRSTKDVCPGYSYYLCGLNAEHDGDHAWRGDLPGGPVPVELPPSVEAGKLTEALDETRSAHGRKEEALLTIIPALRLSTEESNRLLSSPDWPKILADMTVEMLSEVPHWGGSALSTPAPASEVNDAIRKHMASCELALLDILPLLGLSTQEQNELLSDKENWPRRVVGRAKALMRTNPGCLSPACEAGYETCSVCRERKAASEVEAAQCNQSCTFKTSQEKPGSYICKKHKAEAIEAAREAEHGK